MKTMTTVHPILARFARHVEEKHGHELVCKKDKSGVRLTVLKVRDLEAHPHPVAGSIPERDIFIVEDREAYLYVQAGEEGGRLYSLAEEEDLLTLLALAEFDLWLEKHPDLKQGKTFRWR